MHVKHVQDMNIKQKNSNCLQEASNWWYSWSYMYIVNWFQQRAASVNAGLSW